MECKNGEVTVPRSLFGTSPGGVYLIQKTLINWNIGKKQEELGI